MKYNNSCIILLTITLTTLFASCKKDFLDQKTLQVINEDAVFSDSIKTLGFINGRYNDIMYSFDPHRYGDQGLEGACDEAEPKIDITKYPYKISSGAANASNTDKNIWTVSYKQVRACNVFLRNLDSIPVTLVTKQRWQGEIRFLRAWYLFNLVKHYGGIPMLSNKVFNDGDVIDIPRSSYVDCVNYIAAECDTAASMLPLKDPLTTAAYYARASRGAALALKSRLLLYAASPLFNDGTRTDDPQHLLSFANSDNERWRKAAEAAVAVINLKQYDLYKGSTPYFYNMFLQPNGCNEYIFGFWGTDTQYACWVENNANPPTRWTRYQASSSSCFPVQELVDAFPMKNGLPITDPASGYSGIGDNMYKNRDPRFDASIEYNGSKRAFAGYGDREVWTYTGVIPSGSAGSPETSASRDGIYVSGATLTGYYRYKACANEVITSSGLVSRPQLMMRYGEILLNAAEAINEYYGPDGKIDTLTVYSCLKAIRNRAGILAGTDGMFGIKAGMSKTEMRTFIQNERRIELAFEEQRFWDVRRWKIAPVTENREMHGMEITRSASGTFSYRTIVIRKHVWDDKMYFWPIPSSELTKSPALVQNPGY